VRRKRVRSDGERIVKAAEKTNTKRRGNEGKKEKKGIKLK